MRPPRHAACYSAHGLVNHPPTRLIAISSAPILHRRAWLKTSVAVATSLTVRRDLLETPTRAQRESDHSAKTSEAAKINGNETPFGPSPVAVIAIVQNDDHAFRYATAKLS